MTGKTSDDDEGTPGRAADSALTALADATAEPRPGVAPPSEGAATLVRSEERLRVATRTVVTGRVRITKRIVTEDVSYVVPVSREEVVVEEDVVAPDEHEITSEQQALTEHTVELVRYEERVVVSKQLVPVERIRVVRSVVQGSAEVEETLAREHIDVVDDRSAELDA